MFDVSCALSPASSASSLFQVESSPLTLSYLTWSTGPPSDFRFGLAGARIYILESTDHRQERSLGRSAAWHLWDDHTEWSSAQALSCNGLYPKVQCHQLFAFLLIQIISLPGTRKAITPWRFTPTWWNSWRNWERVRSKSPSSRRVARTETLEAMKSSFPKIWSLDQKARKKTFLGL